MTRVRFIRCSDRTYQAFCPQHEPTETEDLTLFWDVVEGTLYCTACGFAGNLEIVAMPGHLLPPEVFSMRMEFSHTHAEDN